jgi:hypothetical protein
MSNKWENKTAHRGPLGQKLAQVADTSFYVDWEGRGYSPQMMQMDIDTMKSALGNGPIYSGGSAEFIGQYFSSAPALGNLTYLRGGQTGPGDQYEAADIQWEQFPNWDALIQQYELLGPPSTPGADSDPL